MSENKGNKGEKTSFWKLLEDYRVEVPIIQRDYAQGRVGKEFLRTKFLEDLKGVLDNESPQKETVQGDVGRKDEGELVLDFVYGSQEGETIRPLDGQQRLTTLWLLHWYIALRAAVELRGESDEVLKEGKAQEAEKLFKEACEVLKNFTYETRISSREFCENLCDPKNFDSFKDQKIVDFIENQTWFSSAWKQDPTIQAMLRMLGGTETNDSIEKLFRKTDYGKYWDKIKGNLSSKIGLKGDGIGRKARKFLLSLDGRQRPLALWLLHWYIAYKARFSLKKDSEDPPKSDEIRKVLKEGIPATLRGLILGTNASKFCENLCDPKNFDSFKEGEIVDFIKKQQWFSATWEQDPTIQSMLRMLGGTENNDSIEKLFKDADYEDYKEYWGKLKDYLDSESKPELEHEDENLKQFLQPLEDAWQRQVAIWLLLWYLACKSKKLNTRAPDPHQKSDKAKKNVLKEKKPISLSEFCKSLVSLNDEQPDGVDIVEHIKKQGWFSATWEQDPTIQTVLRLLGGTKSSDGIEDVFDGVNYKNFWEKLTSNKEPAPIVFYYLRLENFGLSDDLYVKMNARGKPLTPFENFKADLIGYLSKRAANDENWKPLYETIPAKLDNDWTDIFWDKRSNKDKKDEEQKIDEIYFAFLNRFFWNELFVAKTNNEYVLRFSKGSKLESPNSSFEYLDKDSVDEYLGIERYEFLDGEIPISVFKNLEKVLDNYKKYNGEIPLLYGFKDFKFIPEYIGNNNEEKKGNNSEKKGNNSEKKVITGISNRAQRVIFFALCEYFKSFKENYDKEKEKYNTSLGRLMRVVCNLISGKDTYGTYYVREYPGVRDAIEYIDSLEVSKCPHDVYGRLAGMKKSSEKKKKDLSSALDSQWNEEIIKAKQILDDKRDDKRENLRPYKTEKTWEDVIIDAEKHAFFEGSIRFLYQNDKGEVVWDEFATKWGNAQEYFKEEEDNSCVKPGGEGEDKDNPSNAYLLKRLISWFKEDILIDDKKRDKYFRFNNKANTWRYYLLNTKIYEPVHNLLFEKTKNTPSEGVVYLLSSTGLLNFAIRNMSAPWLRKLTSGDFALYELNSKEKAHKYVLLPLKDKNKDENKKYKYEFLSKCGDIKEDPEILPDKNPGTALHYERSDIYFKYKEYSYLRQGAFKVKRDDKEQEVAVDGFIYLLDPPNGNEYKRAIVVDPEKAKSKNEHEKYYCFDPEGLPTEEILKKLENLATCWSKEHTKG